MQYTIKVLLTAFLFIPAQALGANTAPVLGAGASLKQQTE